MKCHFGKSACVKRQYAEGRMLKNTLWNANSARFFLILTVKKQYAERGQLLFARHRGKRERIFILSKCRALVEGPPSERPKTFGLWKRHYEMPTPAKSVCKKTVHGGSDGQEHTMKCHFGKSACVKRQCAEGRMLKNTLWNANSHRVFWSCL